VADLTPGDAAVLDAWRAVRRHRMGEGPAPTARQRELLADPGARLRIEGAQRRGGWIARRQPQETRA
jgi:hypothetical protein